MCVRDRSFLIGEGGRTVVGFDGWPPFKPNIFFFFWCRSPHLRKTWTVLQWRFVVFSELSFSFECGLHSIKYSALHTTAASKRSLNHFVKSSPCLFLKFATWARSPALTIINTVKQQQKNTSYNIKTNKLSVFTRQNSTFGYIPIWLLSTVICPS